MSYRTFLLLFFYSALALLFFSDHNFYSVNNFKEQTTLIANDGMNLWLNQPSSFYYQGKFSRTYFTYTKSNGELVIRYFDHNQQQLSEETVLYKFEYMDDHSSPSLVVVKNGIHKGRVAVAFSFHSSALFFASFDSPEDITTFKLTKFNQEPEVTYPTLIQNTMGHLRIHFRGVTRTPNDSKGLYKYISSTDFGKNWSLPKVIIEFGQNKYIYPSAIYNKNNEIAIAWSIYHLKQKTLSNIYYTYSTNFGKTWKSLDGNSPEINANNALKLYTGKQIRALDIIKHKDTYRISASIFLKESSCCSDQSDCFIIDNQGNTVPFKSTVDYYTSGAFFDKTNSNTIFFPKNNNHGGHNIIKGTITPTFQLIQEAILYGHDHILTRPITTMNTNTSNRFSFLKVLKYEKYWEFKTRLYFNN